MRFLVGFLITMGLLIFAFVLIFRGGDNAEQTNLEGSKLLDYANSSTVVMQFTTLGPVSADLTHNSVRVTVGSATSTVEVIQGYQGNVTATKSYANNSAAYADFLRALQLSGYNIGNPSKQLADERGYCATGNRYILGVKEGNRDIQRYWSTSCGGQGTSKAKASAIQDLFERQIPDYQDVVGDTL